MSGPPVPWAEVVAANTPTCRAPFCGRAWGAGMRQRVFGDAAVVVCERPACVAWGELRSDELLDGYEWREHAARMRRGDCQPRQEARKADGDFGSVAEHIAAWRAGGRRWARVAGFNVDAVQAERTSADLREPPQWAIDGAARVRASIDREISEAMAARCGVPVEIDEPPDPIADRLACLQRVQQRAQTDPEVHQTCDTQDAILDAVVALLELAVRR